MPVIITIIIAIFLIFISWTWHNLGNIDKTKKILTIIISTIIIIIITCIVFNLSKEGVPYKSENEMKDVRTVLIVLFTFINSLIIMPSICKVFGKIYDRQIEQNQAQKRLTICLVIFLVILIFECGYMKSIQLDIMDIYNNALLQ